MDWLATELLTGFQKLLCLGLERTPAEAVIEGTVMTWHEALNIDRAWDEQRDRGRVRKAFTTLARTRQTWPAPMHFLDALPPVEQGAIGYEVKPASKAEADAAMARIRNLLDAGCYADPGIEVGGTETRRVSREELDRAEAELAAHYASQGQGSEP